MILHFIEKSKPRSAGGSETKHPSEKDSGGEDEEADAERGVLEKKRGGGALENGDAVSILVRPLIWNRRFSLCVQNIHKIISMRYMDLISFHAQAL